MFEPQDLPGRYGRVVAALDHVLHAMGCEAVRNVRQTTTPCRHHTRSERGFERYGSGKEKTWPLVPYRVTIEEPVPGTGIFPTRFHLMSTRSQQPYLGTPRSDQDGGLPSLEPGDHLDQKTFHARYETMPDDVKAELIAGVVYMPAALKRSHGRFHSLLLHWLHSYQDGTPGVETYDNTTLILGDDSEPQPDACLIIHPDKGGQMRFTEDDYLAGSPEFVAEVASSTESYDLHSKKRDYERAGVLEYLVIAVRQRMVRWFVNRERRFVEKTPDVDLVYRSEVFPGLWLDTEAILDLDSNRLLAVLREGLAADEHAEFVQRLAG